MTAINENMTSTQTTVPVADPAALAPGFYTIDSENIEVLGPERGETVGDAWDRIGGFRHKDVTEPKAALCIRGVGGSTAATHTSGATLTRYYPDAPGGGSGGLPTGWTQAGDPANVLTNGGRLTLGSDPNDSPYIDAGVLYRPDGTAAVAFDQPDRTELYYPDGESAAIIVNVVGDSRAIEFRKTGAGNSSPVLNWDDTDKKWVMSGDFEYAGNDPLHITGGGFDAGEYKLTNTGDPSDGRDAVNLRTLQQFGAYLPIADPTADPTDGVSLWNDAGVVKVASAPPP